MLKINYKHLSHKFVFQNNDLECVSRYKYLGIWFKNSGSFNFAKNELYQKALKALFKLKSDFLVHNPEVKTSIHVFDLLKADSVKFGVRNGNIPIDQIFSKLHCEKLHLKFCKFLLGVHKISTNFAVQSELGRFPLHFDILKQILRFWHRLENLDWSFPLLKAAYKCMKASNHHGMAPYNIFCKICQA